MVQIKKKYLGKGSMTTVFKDGYSFNVNLDNPLPGQIEMLPKDFVEEVKKEK